jgi:D-3-phosphoglycerate dehydrogenase
MTKVLVTDVIFENLDRERAVLSEIGADLILAPDNSEETLTKLCRDVDGVMANRSTMSAPVINAMERCKVISVYGIGTDRIALDAATAKGILVVNLPGFCAEEVSEQAIMLLLAAARKLVFQNNGTKTRAIPYSHVGVLPISRLAGKTLGIVGLGHIGRAVARKAQGIGMGVIAYDPYASAAAAADLGVQLVGLDDLLQKADHVSLHLPLSAQTLKLIGEKQLRMMKATACLINTSRGKLVDEEALYRALREGWIAGAGLDVVWDDPPSDHELQTLFKLDNVTVTPHTGWYSEESILYMQTNVARNVVLVLTGQQPINIVNPAALQRRG